MALERLLSRLKEYYSAPLEETFKQFRLGAMTFFLGMVIIYISSQSMPDSLKQEIVVLIGLIVGGLGFLVAMFAQLRMLISRILNFWFDDK